eukprot:366555-Chlamydomonas_euryale.AAC.32
MPKAGLANAITSRRACPQRARRTMGAQAQHACHHVAALHAAYRNAERAGVEERYQSLASAFEKQFGSLPEVLARAPGELRASVCPPDGSSCRCALGGQCA